LKGNPYAGLSLNTADNRHECFVAGPKARRDRHVDLIEPIVIGEAPAGAGFAGAIDLSARGDT
jgi:hypothetical protein